MQIAAIFGSPASWTWLSYVIPDKTFK